MSRDLNDKSIGSGIARSPSACKCKSNVCADNGNFNGHFYGCLIESLFILARYRLYSFG